MHASSSLPGNSFSQPFFAEAVRGSRGRKAVSLALRAGCAGLVAAMVGIAGCGGSVSSAGPGSGSSGQGAVTIPATLALTTSTASGTTQNLTIANSGTVTVNVIGFAITGTNASNFGWTSSCGAQLAASTSCTLTVSFSATTAGTYTATLNVTTSASSTPAAVALTGTATPHGTISLPSTLAIYASTATAGSLPITLSNTGPVVINISGFTVGGTNASDFTQTNTCGTQVAIAASCTITVNFGAAAVGTYAGTLSIANDASVGGPATVALTGTEVAPAPAITLSVPSLAFPAMVAGAAGKTQTVTVTNSGGVPLALSSITLTGTAANIFGQSNNCPVTMALGATCTITASFAPTVPGTYAATVSLTDNASTSPQTVGLSGTATPFTIAVNTSTAAAWVIDNGAITFDWNSSTGNLTSWVLDGYSDQLVDVTTVSNSQPDGLYMDNTGSFANANVPTTGGTAAPTTVACTIVGGTVTGTTTCTTGTGSTPYFDWSQTIGDTANSGNAYTFVEHWVVFPNDPGVHTYVQLIHKSSDAAASVGQVQWVFRDNLSIFNNTYEVNPSLTQLGVENIPRPAVSDTSSTDPGRVVQNAAEDLHGFSDIPGTFGRYFDTKYDYAGYEYLHQAHGLYGLAPSGTTYGTWTVLPRIDTFVGGPTKQNLWFTGNIDMIEAYSDHEDLPLNMNTAAGVAYNRLFGPYYYHINVLGKAYNQTGNALKTPADMYADAISAGAAFIPQYDNEAPLLAAGYVASTARGSVSIQMNGVTGATHTAWAVLSDPATNFQVSCNGLEYWADISSTGSTTFTGVAPGTYRLSVYVLGQWGEYRQDGIMVTANNTTIVPTATWVPENFGTATPVFTIGTADRSSHEFLHGHNTTTGNDDREYWGNFNYWQDFASTNGGVVYYATAVGSTPATNNLQLWNYNHWGSSFDPGLFAGVYSANDDTTDGYNYAIPSYVASITGASGTNGVTTPIPPWQVYFATPAGFASQSYVDLSISAACAYGSYVVTLNGHQLIWHYTNYSDCVIRSGLSGYTQWFVLEWPVSDLNQTVGGSNEITVSMSQQYGAEDDAWRLELTNTSAAPSVRGWNDYQFISTTAPNGTGPNDAVPNP